MTAEIACPACGACRLGVHSGYGRRLADTAVAGREMLIRLRVRRFFCSFAPSWSCSRLLTVMLGSVMSPFFLLCSGGRRQYVRRARSLTSQAPFGMGCTDRLVRPAGKTAPRSRSGQRSNTS
ncbi:transposase family protein [Amycolatopsis magusensis]|uniref:transposase family protein n=1 Tax=Amycolatopsis magusensis TaxID=882444 RepID=UPI001AEA1DA6